MMPGTPRYVWQVMSSATQFLTVATFIIAVARHVSMQQLVTSALYRMVHMGVYEMVRLIFPVTKLLDS